MKSNIKLSTLETMLIGDISALPIEQLHRLLAEANAQVRKAKMLREWLDGAINLKYRNHVAQQDKLFGTIRIEDDGFVILCKIPKKVEWDQLELAKTVQAIQLSGNDPSEYVEFSYRIAERKYTAWPEQIRKQFEKARTLKTGKPNYVIKPIENLKGGTL